MHAGKQHAGERKHKHRLRSLERVWREAADLARPDPRSISREGESLHVLDRSDRSPVPSAPLAESRRNRYSAMNFFRARRARSVSARAFSLFPLCGGGGKKGRQRRNGAILLKQSKQAIFQFIRRRERRPSIGGYRSAEQKAHYAIKGTYTSWRHAGP